MATPLQTTELISKRVVLFTGKGGVGRSTIAAAFATLAARRGKRVLLAEIDDETGAYSPLARYFGQERLPREEARELAPGIRGASLLARHGQELFLESVLRSRTVARAAVQSEAIRRLGEVAPSLREMGIFYRLLSFLRETVGKNGPLAHELILIDMPATGHALALTGLPEILLRLLPKGPIAQLLREGQSYLNDPARGAAYVVTLPEKLPVTESLELVEGLRRTSMPVGGVILNRMPQDPFTARERARLSRHLDRSRHLGAEGFHRFEDCRRAIDRLTEAELPLITLPEASGSGPALVNTLAEALKENNSP